jgi:hypothetical protein
MSWEKFASPPGTVHACEFQGTHAVESDLEGEDMDHIRLSTMIVPFDVAKDGDIVALGFPFEKEGWSLRPLEALKSEDLSFLIKKGNTAVAIPLVDVPEDIRMRQFSWAEYSLNINDWHTHLGKTAVRGLLPYTFKVTKATAYFFSDFTVAVPHGNCQ